eukprot:SAG22_NODE_9968_length_560_cov_1.971800_2_plen_65_part_01
MVRRCRPREGPGLELYAVRGNSLNDRFFDRAMRDELEAPEEEVFESVVWWVKEDKSARTVDLMES